ncbi:MAG TPA: hypothetical protein VFV48_00125 [Pseudomonadales bacterium]|nr:hypothetical protein [Pseudomonadales bacterium]
MHILLLSLLVVVAAMALVKKWPRLTRQEKTQWTLILLILGLGLLAITGRLNWLGLVVAALVGAVRVLTPWLLRLLPFAQQVLKEKNQAPPSQPHKTMSRAEALEILGLQEGVTREDIIEMHRKLIQKLHPDRGGNTYLASKINQARDCLLS